MAGALRRLGLAALVLLAVVTTGDGFSPFESLDAEHIGKDEVCEAIRNFLSLTENAT